MFLKILHETTLEDVENVEMYHFVGVPISQCAKRAN